jgi:hypothetical protein
VALVVAGGAACGDDGDDTGDQRAAQARDAATGAGLDDDVADFLGLLARGDTATYRVRFPGPVEGSELVIANRPPDRRVEVVSTGEVTEVRLATGGQAFECTPDDDGFTCRRTDALVEPPGVFRDDAVERLGEALAARAEDYTFDVEERTVAETSATCLVTRLRAGRESAERGATGTICASAEGAVVLVNRSGERLEATEYGTEVDAEAFVRPDQADAG